MGLLDGKVAVITGAGSGMAKASTKVFVREGAKVVAADISGAEKDTAAEVGEGVLAVHCDVTKEEDVAAAMHAALEEFGRLDAVLNVAGIGTPERFTSVSMDTFDTIMDVNLRGVLHGMKHGILAMLETGGGSIINWSSVGGLNASGFGTSVYSASKAGVISATKAAAVEYGSKGIRVNAICPGFILTEIMGASGEPEVPRDVREGRTRTGRRAPRGGRGGCVPGVGPRFLRDGRDHSGRRWVVGPAGLSADRPDS